MSGGSTVKAHLLTIFPELFGGPLATGPIRIAREKGALDVAVHDLRDYTTDKHLVVDDVPYGGGQGMVMKPEPVVAAIEHITTQAGAGTSPRSRSSIRRTRPAPRGGSGT